MVLYSNMVEQIQDKVEVYSEVDPFGYLWYLIPDPSAMIGADCGRILIQKDIGKWEGFRRFPPTIDVWIYDKKGLRLREAYVMTPDGVDGEMHIGRFKPLVSGHRLDTTMPGMPSEFNGMGRLRFERAKDVARFVRMHAGSLRSR